MSTTQAFICDAVRTPFGRYGGALSSVRADDLGAIPIKALMARNAKVDWAAVDRRALRLRQPGRRGQPQRRAHGGAARRPAGRTCRARRSTACAARAWTRSAPRRARSSAGEAELMIAGGVESMSRAPFVMPKAESAFARSQRGLRHHHRLALRQQADEGAVRRRLDARDGRERRRPTSRSSARRRTAWRWRRSRRRWRRRRPASSTPRSCR